VDRVCCKAMNWLPSLRALLIFGVLLALFAVGYWACGGLAKGRASLETGEPLGEPCLWPG
jgi:hypothetical protein